jgi:DNA-binding LacI/PurR family transcriptional regulator
MQAPKKISLATQAADILRQQILDKKFTKVLPGETPLAANLRVSRKTVREALAILENEKIISPAEPGKRREIFETVGALKPKSANETVRILLPKPIREMHASAQHLFRTYIHHLQIEEDDVEYHHLPYASSKTDIRPRLAELVDSHRASLWVIYELNKEIAEVITSRGLNAIACGGITNTKIPVVTYHGSSAIQHALNKLFQNGHTNIVKPTTHPHLNFDYMAKVFEKQGMTYLPEYNTPYYSGTAQDFSLLLQKLFLSETPPTAFITSGPRELISLITWLGVHRLSIPKDVSILHIGSDPLLDSIFPQISYYSTSSDPIARELARLSNTLIQTPQKTLENKFFYMDYKAGESLAPVTTQSNL